MVGVRFMTMMISTRLNSHYGNSDCSPSTSETEGLYLYHYPHFDVILPLSHVLLVQYHFQHMTETRHCTVYAGMWDR